MLELKKQHVALYFVCSFIAVNSNQLIRNILVGRSGEEKKRNRRVAEQVAGSFCYAGLDGSSALLFQTVPMWFQIFGRDFIVFSALGVFLFKILSRSCSTWLF